MEVNDVCLLELRQCGDVRTGVGDVNGKDVVSFEAVGFPYDDTFPYEFPHHTPVVA